MTFIGPGLASTRVDTPSYPGAETLITWEPGAMLAAVAGEAPTKLRSTNTCAPGTSVSISSIDVVGAAGVAGSAAAGAGAGAAARRRGSGAGAGADGSGAA